MRDRADATDTIEQELMRVMAERQTRLIRSVVCDSAQRRDAALIAWMAQEQAHSATYVPARETSRARESRLERSDRHDPHLHDADAVCDH
jgi:hypothetical protein